LDRLPLQNAAGGDRVVGPITATGFKLALVLYREAAVVATLELDRITLQIAARCSPPPPEDVLRRAAVRLFGFGCRCGQVAPHARRRPFVWLEGRTGGAGGHRLRLNLH
jgi:hypothetical protein